MGCDSRVCSSSHLLPTLSSALTATETVSTAQHLLSSPPQPSLCLFIITEVEVSFVCSARMLRASSYSPFIRCLLGNFISLFWCQKMISQHRLRWLLSSCFAVTCPLALQNASLICCLSLLDSSWGRRVKLSHIPEEHEEPWAERKENVGICFK